MHVRLHRSYSVLACTLVVLLFVLSFNAYACLLPVSGITEAAMGKGCSTPEEPPIYQFCDAFKTLGVQSVDKLHFDSDSQVLCPEDTASLAFRAAVISHSSHLYDHPLDGPPQDLLLKISVLRI